MRKIKLEITFGTYSITSMMKNLPSVETRVSIGIPGYSLRTEMIRKFFISIMEKVPDIRNSGTISGITKHYGKSFRNFPRKGSGKR